MLFHAYEFIFLFLPISIAGFYFLISKQVRAAMVWLIVCSLFFYGYWNPAYLPLILGSCFINYVIGRYLQRTPSRMLLTLGVGFNLALLGYFKYAVFISGFFADATALNWRIEDIVLPLGISFFTIQQIAYLVDAKEKRTAEHGWLEYILFVTFFPQLIAGPIVHQSEMMPQFDRRNLGFKKTNLAIGMTIFVLGFVKKVVIAETFADYASPMFNAASHGAEITLLEAWAGAISYTFQLYFDFSGYSDMAIGIARMFSIRLPINFNAPFRATSIIEFWKRWHMTLTRFINTYLFNPLALRTTRDRSAVKKSLNPSKDVGAFFSILAVPTLFSMFIAGIWHGAGWTFLVFGILHGAYLVINHGWRLFTHGSSLKKCIPQPLGLAIAWSLTFLCVVISFVFFRAANIDTAWNIILGLVGADGRVLLTHSYLKALPFFEAIFPSVSMSDVALPYFAGRKQIMMIMVGLFIVWLAPTAQSWMARYYLAPKLGERARWMAKWYHWRPTPLWAFIFIVMLCLGLLSALQPTEFLYFQC